MLKPLTIDDKPVFDSYACQADTKLSNYAFASNWIWQDLFDFQWTVINDQFCLFARQIDSFFMPIMPMGRQLNQNTIRYVWDFMISNSRNDQIVRIEAVPEEKLPLFHLLGFQPFLKETEYLYDRNQLTYLRGNSYKSKRSSINSLIRSEQDLRIDTYQPAMFDQCLELYHRWQLERQTKYDETIYQAMLADSLIAHKSSLIHFEQLELVGLLGYINGELKAYTCGYQLNPQIFCILFEVVDLEVKGLPQFIFREFCRSRTECQLSTMGDSNLENLRKVKLSYRPIQTIPVYNVRYEE